MISTCLVLVQSMLALADSAPEASLLLNRSDSLLREGYAPNTLAYANLVVARLHEAQGSTTSALAALKRRSYESQGGYVSSYLREEGRLAAMTGDREGAIRAYQHYLALRSHPEPSVKPEVDQVRAELAKLISEQVP